MGELITPNQTIPVLVYPARNTCPVRRGHDLLSRRFKFDSWRSIPPTSRYYCCTRTYQVPILPGIHQRRENAALRVFGRSPSLGPSVRAGGREGPHRVLQRMKAKQAPRGQEVSQGPRARHQLRGCRGETPILKPTKNEQQSGLFQTIAKVPGACIFGK